MDRKKRRRAHSKRYIQCRVCRARAVSIQQIQGHPAGKLGHDGRPVYKCAQCGYRYTEGM